MTQSLTHLIAEELSLWRCYIILRVKQGVSRTAIFNELRAIESVVIIEPITSQLVSRHDTELHAFSLVECKFLAVSEPMDALKRIRQKAVQGTEDSPPVQGLVQFIIQKQSLKRLDQQ